MKSNRKWIAMLVMLTVVSLACGSPTNTGVEVVSTADPDSQPTPAQVETHNIGDVIKTGSQTITLNSAQVVGSLLQANFTIENLGTDNIPIGPLINFEARDAEGTKLELEIWDCPAGNLQSTILAGDKLKGNICWKGLTTDSAKIYYNPEVFSATRIVWEVK